MANREDHEPPSVNCENQVQRARADSCISEVQFLTRDSTWEKIKFFWTTWSIEPFMFLFMFAYTTRTNCMTNLMLEKACLNNLNYSRDICRNLSSYQEIKVEVEKVANVYIQYTTLTTMGIGALAMIFIGAWSDRYGRKPPLLISIVGIILDDVGVILNIVYFSAPLAYLIIPFAASGVTGGFICVMFTTYSMTSELTGEKQRTMKYAILQLAHGLGQSFGTLTGADLYMHYTVRTVVIVATLGHLLLLPWALFAIPETRGTDVPDNIRWTTKLRDLFLPKDLCDGFRAYLKPRPNYGRPQLWFLLMSLCICILAYESFSNMQYMYVFHMYDWSIMKFSVVETIYRCIGLILIVLCLPSLIRIFKMKDPTLGFVGSISMATKSLCTALAAHEWIYYLGENFGILKGASMLTIRSQVSKIVEEDELGKVFNFLAICETFAAACGSIAMTGIYNESITFFPGLCYLIIALLLIFPIVSFWWMMQLETPTLISTNRNRSGSDVAAIIA